MLRGVVEDVVAEDDGVIVEDEALAPPLALRSDSTRVLNAASVRMRVAMAL